MRKRLLTIITALLAVFALSAGTAGAATVGTLAGFTQPETDMAGMLGAPLCAPPNICQVVHYNNNWPDPFNNGGAEASTVFVNTTTGEKILAGYSLGGADLTVYVLRNLSGPTNLRVITFGNPLVGRIPGTVAYPVTEVINEYDAASDRPQDWWNLFAALNVQASQRHGDYSSASLTAPASVYVDGNVTYRLVDTYPLPLIAWMDPASAAFWDPILRPWVDSAYHRTYTQYPQQTATVTATEEATPSTDVSVAVSPSVATNTATSAPTSASSTHKAPKPKHDTVKPARKPAHKATTAKPANKVDSVKPKHGRHDGS